MHAVWRSIATLRCVPTRCAARAARPTRRGRPRRQRARRRTRCRQRPRGRRRARRAAPGRHGARGHHGAALESGAWPPSSGRRGTGRLGTDPVLRRTSYYMMNTRHCGEVYFTGVIHLFLSLWRYRSIIIATPPRQQPKIATKPSDRAAICAKSRCTILANGAPESTTTKAHLRGVRFPSTAVHPPRARPIAIAIATDPQTKTL